MLQKYNLIRLVGTCHLSSFSSFNFGKYLKFPGLHEEVQEAEKNFRKNEHSEKEM